MAEQNYSYSNESFSGCDMVATVLLPKGYLGEKQVYTLGELQTISYSIHMDRSPVRSIGNINAKDYVMGPRTIAGSLVFAVFNKHFANKIMKDISEAKNPGYAFLIDEIPPFDIVISAANEYGLRSRMVIYGVRLVNEGQVMSVNDVYTENTYQFVATDLEYLTDENQYTSKGTSGSGIYKIVENDIVSYGNNIDYNFKKKAITRSIKSILSCKVRTLATDIKKGIVDFWITPTTKDGVISIEGPESKDVAVAKSIDSNGKIAVQLQSGSYTAIWTKNPADERSETSMVKFVVARKEEEEIIEILPPLIERVGDNFIEIHSNVKNHTKILYMDQDKNTFSMNLDGKRVRIDNLEPSREYSIATCNDDITIVSGYVKVTTLKIGHDEYKDFLEYLNYNKSSLKNNDFNKYSELVLNARDASFSNMNNKGIADNLLEIKTAYEEQLSEINQIDFPGLIEYQNAINKIAEKIDILSEIIHIINSITNDKVYGYNYNVKVVEAPKLEFTDFSTNYLLVGYDIARIEFYRQLTNTRQFTKTIERRNFKDNKNGYVCKFEGRPNAKYYAYAINEYGFRSPKVEFYTMPHEDKAEAIVKNEMDVNLVNYEIAKAKDENGYKVDTILSEEEEKRLYSEIVKGKSSSYIEAPSILSVDEISIKVHIKQFLNVLKENSCKLAISSVDEALKNSPKYKISISDNNEFTLYEHGLKKDNDYLIWIEDKNGHQISDSISVNFKPSDHVDELREYELNRIFVNDKIDLINKYFREDNLLTSQIENLLKKVSGEISTNKINVFDKVIEEIILNIGNLNNIYSLIYTFYKAKLDGSFLIDESYFKEPPELDRDNKKIKIKEDCLAHLINIDKQGITEMSIRNKIEEGISLDSNSLYTVIHFTSNDLSRKGGFMVVNNNDNTYKTYKVLIKVGGR